jgi:hypothetical protein
MHPRYHDGLNKVATVGFLSTFTGRGREAWTPFAANQDFSRYPAAILTMVSDSLVSAPYLNLSRFPLPAARFSARFQKKTRNLFFDTSFQKLSTSLSPRQAGHTLNPIYCPIKLVTLLTSQLQL